AVRLKMAGSSWEQISAVLLTHTHSDHWHDATFTWLAKRDIPLYCHAGHRAFLQAGATVFVEGEGHEAIRCYSAGEEMIFPNGLRCRPIPLRHDGGPT